MVVVPARDWMEVDDALGECLEARGEIDVACRELVQHAPLVWRVDEYRAPRAERPQQALGERAHRWSAVELEKLGVLDRSAALLDVARPLKRQCLEGPRAGEDRHGRPDRLEVQVV